MLENFHLEGTLMFYECTFEHALGMFKSKVDSLVSWNSKYDKFYIDGIECNRFISSGDEIKDYMEFYGSTFHQEFEIKAKSNSFELSECTFATPSPTISLINDKLFNETNPSLVVNVTIEANEVSIDDNKFISESDFDILLFNLKNTKEVLIARNKLGGLVSLKGNTNFIKIFSNKLNRIEFNEFSFPEFESSIGWDDISGNKITGMFNTGHPDGWVPRADSVAFYKQMNFGVWEEQPWTPQFYFGQSDKELRFKWFYDELFSDYYRMYALYKAKGKIADANNLYIEMKELYGRRLAIIYKDDPTLRNLLNWKLNRLLKLYTDHGTDPAKAIVISIYIIFIFSAFYFLFPSEWDEFEFSKTKWKKQSTLKNLKSILIHLANSFVLSLNSFVTLGFGRIPTTGFARYICIFQGFVGWFLLSIFTVS